MMNLKVFIKLIMNDLELKGLTSQEAQKRLEKYRLNKLKAKEDSWAL